MNQEEQKQSKLDVALIETLRPWARGGDGSDINYYDVKGLLDQGANPNARYLGQKGSIPVLLLALENEREDIIGLLLDKGADVNGRSDYFSRTILMSAAFLHVEEKILKLLLDRGAEIEARDARGATPLMYAADRRNEAHVNLLLERGADLTARDNENNNIFTYAVGCGFSLHGSSSDISNLLVDRLVQKVEDETLTKVMDEKLESISQEVGKLNASMEGYNQKLKAYEEDFKGIAENIRKDATKFKAKDDSSAQAKNAERPAIDFHR